MIGTNGESIIDSQGSSSSDFSLQELDGITEFDNMEPDGMEIQESVMLEESIPEEVQELYKTVTNYMKEVDLDTDITLSRDQEGVYIDIQEAILFDSGSATLKMSGKETVGTLAGLFDLFENEIIVEGYTDDVPMSNRRFPSNWSFQSLELFQF